MKKSISQAELKKQLQAMVDKAGETEGEGTVILGSNQLRDKLNLEYQMGQTVAFEYLSNHFKEQAGEAFANRQDVVAKFYRELEDKMKERGKSFRKGYEEKLVQYQKAYPEES